MPRRIPASAGVLAAVTMTAITAITVSAAGAGAAPLDPSVQLSAAPSWTASTHATGAAKADTALSLTVTLPLRDSAGAEAFARSVADPKSSSFRHYLTPGEFTARFGATEQSVRSVAAYLSSKGLSVGSVSDSRAYLPVTGTVAAVDQAFGASMRTYVRGNRTVIAPSAAVSVPSSLKGSIGAVLGLDSSAVVKTFNQKPLPASNADTSACSTYYGQNYDSSLPKGKAPLHKKLPTYLCGFTPSQLQTLRSTPKTGLTGKGVTVGINLWCNDPRIEADTNRWAKALGWPRLRSGQYTVVPPSNGYDPNYCNNTTSGGTNVEQALDVQAIHGAAPAADIVYGAAAAPMDWALIRSFYRMIDANKVDAINNSWGELEADESAGGLMAYRSVFLQAAAQGISVLFSAGDNGDNSAGDASATPAQANYPASDPWVTSVGGTSVAPADASGSKLAFEQGWNTDYALFTGGAWTSWAYLFGGGGGMSSVFPEPYYQKGVVAGRYLGSPAARAYPDLSNIADPYTGYLIGFHDDSGVFSISDIGGTSLASPYTAGTIALAIQSGKDRRVGFVNPTLYSPSKGGLRDLTDNSMTHGFEFRSASSGTPVVIGVNSQQVQDQTLRIGRGWDGITGVGVVSQTAPFVRALVAGHAN